MGGLLLTIARSFSRKERLLAGGAAILTILSGVLLALIIFNQKTIVVPDDGGSYTEGVVGQPSYVNPILAKSGTPDSDLTTLLFASVTDMAESVKHDKRFQTWNVRIKEGAVWHDGTPITSDDVIFTVQTIQNQDVLSPHFSDWQNVSVSRVSEREVQFELATPYSLFGNLLADLRPVPKKLFADLSPAHINLSPYMLKPIGSGPFAYDYLEVRRDGFITSFALKANDAYGAIGNVPHIKNFVIRFYENRDNLLRAYNLGVIDGFGSSDYVSPSDIRLNSTTLAIATSKYYALFFNQNANGALASENVRIALTRAIDKTGLAQKTLDGTASSEHGPIPSTLPSYNPELEQYDTFDQNAARDLLSQDGWTFDQGANAWMKKSGNATTTLALSITTINVAPLNAIARFVQSSWNSLGVPTDITFVDPQEIGDSALKTRDYQVLLFGNIVSPTPDLYSFWHSSQKFYPGLNLALYDSATADKLIESLRAIAADDPARQDKLDQLQNIIVQDAPAVFLVSPRYYYVHKHSIDGIIIGTMSLPESRFDDVTDWYVKTKRVFK